jgi:hypothetical protein
MTDTSPEAVANFILGMRWQAEHACGATLDEKDVRMVLALAARAARTEAEALDWRAQVGELSDQVKALKAENARLRGALPARLSLTEEDREWIDAEADRLFRESERRRGSVRPATIRPQDYRDYFVVNATYHRILAALEKPHD